VAAAADAREVAIRERRPERDAAGAGRDRDEFGRGPARFEQRVRGPEERKHAEHVNLRDGAVSDAATLWTRAQDLVVLAHGVQRRVHCFALPVRDTFPRASTEERQGEAG
jgi:hypothetical protein